MQPFSEKAGITLLNLCRQEFAPQYLLSSAPVPPSSLMATLDMLDKKYDRNSETIGRLPRTSPNYFIKSNSRSAHDSTR